ncbi:MAG: hypothetical protein FD153_1114 [Rhodospirillaceae bacterium]|nr:MAG: hypothetical protein FD153_1114 [Rhodospirillaceae bacterium]
MLAQGELPAVPLKLEEAIARTLPYNLDKRVKVKRGSAGTRTERA